MQSAQIYKVAPASGNKNERSSFTNIKIEKEDSARESESLHFDSKAKNIASGDENSNHSYGGLSDFQNISILPPTSSVIQPKLKINAPNDKYEQEADRVAEQVMRMPTQTIQRKCEKCGNEKEIQWAPQVLVQRKCAKCELEEEMIQTKSMSNSANLASSFLVNQIQNTRGSGQAMDIWGGF